MIRRLSILLGLALSALPACAQPARTVACESLSWKGTPVTVCEIAPGADIRLHRLGADGKPLRDFDRLAGSLAPDERVVFAMNAGMYHRDRSAVGLYVEDGVEQQRLIISAGPGNFHLLPNGVFWVDADGVPHVDETFAYAALGPDPVHATQSGPMLVVGGALHPDFIAGGTSRRIRNGIGVVDGRAFAAISDAPMNFHDFATLFRDHLATPDALYLDGTISRVMIAGERKDGGIAMGPILSVVEAD